MVDEDAHGPRVDVPSDALAVISMVCESCNRLSGTDGASVTLLGADRALSPLYATDEVAARVDDMQFTLGEGPCMAAVGSGVPVLVDDLFHDRSGPEPLWPGFDAEVVDLGVRGLYAFPVRIGAISLGALELYRSTPGPMSSPQLAAALNAVDVLGGVLLDLGRGKAYDDVVPTYRLVVHQAAGMLTVQLDVSIEEAMTRLRAAAYSTGRTVNEMAADIVEGRTRLTQGEP